MKILSLFIIILFIINFSAFPQQTISKIERLTVDADIILTGKVIQQKSIWNDNQSKIYTNVTIEVEEYLKGKSNNSKIIITYPGGEIGEVGELYSHMPEFKNDEEVLLFVKKNEKENTLVVLNGQDGKLTLSKDLNSGEKITSSNEKVSEIKKSIKQYINE
ncbi:MAG TPA: hypothetical protein VLN45_10005 [Ignavibacteriaceae bacterium]|nr:hypothetical protein [Ignavibacteriaceae bacterium]